MAIAQNLLGMQDAGVVPEFFDVLLHLGTLVAVFVAYWGEIKDMVRELICGVRDIAHHSTPHPGAPGPAADFAYHRGYAPAVCGAAY